MSNFLSFFKGFRRTYSIFLLDDDEIVTDVMKKSLTTELSRRLKDFKFNIEAFNAPNQKFLSAVSKTPPDFLLLDYHIDLPGGKEVTGISVLKRMKKEHPNMTVIMLTNEDRVETAVELMREGAFDFVLKTESASVNLVKAIGRKLSLLRLTFSSSRNRTLVIGMVIFWVATLGILMSMGVLFPTLTGR